MKSPFPWFGGKSRAASLVWQALGDVPNYIEPFAGSLAVLLARPHQSRTETVNDIDGFISNFWRAVHHDPESVVRHADAPVNEVDLHARHIWLVNNRMDLESRLMGDPDYFDAKIAGWWFWGLSIWIGSGWCSGRGPWQTVGGKLVHVGAGGVSKQRPNLGKVGLRLSKIDRQDAMGVLRKRPALGKGGRGAARTHGDIYEEFLALADRLRSVRVCCGEWSRVLTPAVAEYHGTTGIFLDPPYDTSSGRQRDLYVHDARGISAAIGAWALANGDNPDLRIVLAGYEGEHVMPDTWRCESWTASGGYGNYTGSQNRYRERLWFSPHCLRTTQLELIFTQ